MKSMGINIKGLNVKKDKIIATHYNKYGKVHTTTKLEGKLNLELEQNGFTGSGEIEVAAISENLHNKLYDVLVEIENELNGVTNKTNTGGFTVTSHNGETVLTSDEVGNMYVKGNVEFSDTKLKQPEEVKTHETDKEEINIFDEIEKAMSEFRKVVEVKINKINQESDSKKFAKKLAEKIKEANGDF